MAGESGPKRGAGLRVIAGRLRGRRIEAPPGHKTRPTADRVREALFDLIGSLPQGGRVLDLFAGSGALGIEALSRGASHATFVERDRRARSAIWRNLQSLALTEQAEVLPGDALRAAARLRGRFDVVFADPPYRSGSLEGVLAMGAELLTESGVLALEHAASDSAPEPAEKLALWKSRRYGDTVITLYRRREETL